MMAESILSARSVPSDADRAVLPVLSEEPAQSVRYAADCAMHSSHV